jgi:hypothetical protein
MVKIYHVAQATAYRGGEIAVVRQEEILARNPTDDGGVCEA